MPKLLDPTLDLVFKLLFTSGPDSDIALRGLLAAVLTPPRPIAAVTLVNPAITGAEIANKSIVLDLLLELDDGTLVDVEMQARDRGAFRNRALFYWAKLYSGQLDRGEDYAELKPAISVLFLDYRELPDEDFHSVFHVLEKRRHARLSDAFEMHLIELPKLDRALLAADRSDEVPLLQWSKFLAAKTDEDRKVAAMSNPAIQKANAVLERLSADPDTQQLARQRELAQQTYRIEMSAALNKGRDEGLRIAVLDLCEVLGVTPTEEQRAQLERLDARAIEALRARLKKDRRWALERVLEPTPTSP